MFSLRILILFLHTWFDIYLTEASPIIMNEINFEIAAIHTCVERFLGEPIAYTYTL